MDKIDVNSFDRNIEMACVWFSLYRLSLVVKYYNMHIVPRNF